jgi:hypothetical protein
MKIPEVLSMKAGEGGIDLEMNFAIGKTDELAFKILEILYAEMADKGYDDAGQVLIEALWWNTTFHTIASQHKLEMEQNP